MAFRSYSSVAKSETEDLEAPNTPHSPQRHQQCWPFSSSFWLSLLLSLSTILSFGILYQGFIVLSLSSAPIECPNPVIRREWRTLGKNEQIEYLEAVNCLRTLNSKIGMNHSLYDDFPFIHSRVGNYSHKTTEFLVWHRYFLQIYENALKEDCNYRGHLTYWDWSLDSVNIEESPVFDLSYGFGGNGNNNASRSVAYGHCVTDGPFSMLQALYFGAETKRHCLSRGFVSPGEARNKSHLFDPEAIENYLKETDFVSFYEKLEFGAHNAIPLTIRGDFYMVTAPYDPLFFLHHTQLDRIWYTWQSRDPATRILKLSGKAPYNETEQVLLRRMLSVGGLGKDISVAETLNTRAGVFCYSY